MSLINITDCKHTRKPTGCLVHTYGACVIWGVCDMGRGLERDYKEGNGEDEVPNLRR